MADKTLTNKEAYNRINKLNNLGLSLNKELTINSNNKMFSGDLHVTYCRYLPEVGDFGTLYVTASGEFFMYIERMPKHKKTLLGTALENGWITLSTKPAVVRSGLTALIEGDNSSVTVPTIDYMFFSEEDKEDYDPEHDYISDYNNNYSSEMIEYLPHFYKALGKDRVDQILKKNGFDPDTLDVVEGTPTAPLIKDSPVTPL